MAFSRLPGEDASDIIPDLRVAHVSAVWERVLVRSTLLQSVLPLPYLSQKDKWPRHRWVLQSVHLGRTSKAVVEKNCKYKMYTAAKGVLLQNICSYT